MNSQGIPGIKELWTGIVVDPNAKDANRHLKLAGLSACELHLEMVEEPIGDDDDDDDDMMDEGCCPECDQPIEQCECAEDDDDDGPFEEPCKDYPKGCAKCAAYECTAELPIDDDEDPMSERLVVKTRKKGEKAWKEMSEATMEKNPALCRFLTEIASTHGL